MHLTSVLGCSLVFAVFALTLAERPMAPPAAPAAPAATPTTPAAPRPAAPPVGHRILIVQGTVQQLAITHAVAKKDPWAGVPKGLTSPFHLRLLGDGDAVLADVPVDLSRFDTDPQHIGTPMRVQGCELRDSAIALSVNVPAPEGVLRYEFVHDGKPIGSTAHDAVARMTGEVR